MAVMSRAAHRKAMAEASVGSVIAGRYRLEDLLGEGGRERVNRQGGSEGGRLGHGAAGAAGTGQGQHPQVADLRLDHRAERRLEGMGSGLLRGVVGREVFAATDQAPDAGDGVGGARGGEQDRLREWGRGGHAAGSGGLHGCH